MMKHNEKNNASGIRRRTALHLMAAGCMIISAVTVVQAAAPDKASNCATLSYEGKLKMNKKIAIAFHDRSFNKHDMNVFNEYFAPNFIEHSPMVSSDDVAAERAMVEAGLAQMPQFSSEIKHVIAEGDFVVLHHLAKPTPQARGTVFANIYRFENCLIAEHWDVAQEVPEHSRNPRDMY